MILLLAACTTMAGVAVSVPAASETGEISENEIYTYNFPFVPRYLWQAREAKEKTPLECPVPYVVIHHSYTPAACYSDIECCQAMRTMQNMHIDDRGWWDIGYNFGVGSDGAVYEGRGWDVLGAHALHFNTVSIGICLIGNWNDTLPPATQIKAAKALIAAGVRLGRVRPDYRLVGHRQVRQTECPGQALYQHLQHWAHYSPRPACAADLPYVPELKGRYIPDNTTTKQ